MSPGSNSKKSIRVLISEEQTSLREVLCLLIESSFVAEFIECASNEKAIQYLASSSPRPDLIIADFDKSTESGTNLYDYVKAHCDQIPFVLSSIQPATNYPQFKDRKKTGYVQKPYSFAILIGEIKRLFAETDYKISETQQYVPVSLKILLDIKNISCPLYLKLSGDKYVKMINENMIFSSAEAERFRLKGAQKLYVEQKHFNGLISKYYTETMSQMMFTAVSANNSKNFEFSTSAVELISGAIKSFGWDQETTNLAKKNIQIVKNIADLSGLQDIFDPKKMKENEYSTVHSMLISYITTYFAKNYKFESAHAQEALALAAFFHDISLENHLTRNESRFAFAISMGVGMNKNDIEAVRSHPERSVQLMKSWPEYLEDVLTIIRQHHELPDGTGFPDKLKAVSLSELSRAFIVAHHAADFYLEFKDKRIAMTELKKKAALFETSGFSDFYNLALRQFQ